MEIGKQIRHAPLIKPIYAESELRNANDGVLIIFSYISEKIH